MVRTDKIRLVVADEQPVIVLGLQTWFEARERYRVVASATDEAQLLWKLRDANAELVIVDCALGAHARPAADRFGILRVLRGQAPHAAVVALTRDTDPLAVRAMQRAGADGIASTRDELKDLGRVCDRVLSGVKGVISRRIAACPESEGRIAHGAFNPNAIYREVRVSATTLPARN
ncbi:response regulator [Caballeronia sp. LZ062]|uniref:response regulator n=1 Tax=unclassified Caballeronia TaxID=2646786 RepID=UPI00285EB13F|nr:MULTISPECIES: response regulator [unclassified Caballeronia]MDR5856279.1 response regulator [Caballeronia sp. LZ050]MDR5872950.1 response regulator [Caballeronia sp. LZ062]